MLVLDTETTGVDIYRDRVLSIAALPLHGARLYKADAFDRLVNPGIAIPPASSAIHGITDAMVRDAPAFAEVARALLPRIDGLVLVGHNVGFDAAMLRREAKAAGIDWPERPTLCLAQLEAVLEPEGADLSLDAMARRRGIDVHGRHTALGDVLVTAEIVVHMLPRLADRGVTTFGQVRRLRRARRRADREAARRRLVRRRAAALMDISGLERIDSFPYRHRVADVMRAPAVTAPPAMTLAEGARRMNEAGISSLVVTANGRPVGIVTERDLLRAVAERGGDGLALSLSAIMSSPVEAVPPDVFVYVALARMARRGLRHLAVVDHDGRLAGVLTAGALLRQRAGRGLALADEVQRAEDPAAMAAVMRQLPALARGLLAEGTQAREVAAVISAVVRDITARSAELAEAKLVAEGQGPAPAAYACLVLGSAGRGESLLVPDQDNAVVHAGDARDAPWFAGFGRHLADLLAAAGVPYCKGKVMASEPLWRHTLAGWEGLIDRWVAAPKPEDLLNVDIFFDFVPVHGDRALAARLRAHATEAAARAPAFLRLLAEAMKTHAPALRPVRRPAHQGRPGRSQIGRAPAARHRRAAHGAQMREPGDLDPGPPGCRARVRRAQHRGRGRARRGPRAAAPPGPRPADRRHRRRCTPPSTRVELARLARPLRRRLAEVLRQVDGIEMNVRDVLTR